MTRLATRFLIFLPPVWNSSTLSLTMSMTRFPRQGLLLSRTTSRSAMGRCDAQAVEKRPFQPQSSVDCLLADLLSLVHIDHTQHLSAMLWTLRTYYPSIKKHDWRYRFCNVARITPYLNRRSIRTDNSTTLWVRWFFRTTCWRRIAIAACCPFCRLE
jgi:hypothetical protein